MKKISRRSFLAAAGLTVAALALTACGGSASTASSAAASSVAASSEAASTSAAAAELTTVEAGKLTMATNATFPPYEMTTDAGTIEGIDVDTAQAIAEKLGLELQIMPMSFDACQTAVYAGTVDMTISGFSWTEERTQNYNISNYYHAGDNEDEQVLITLASNGDKFATADGLKGAKIGAQNASLQQSLATEQLPDSVTSPLRSTPNNPMSTAY